MCAARKKGGRAGGNSRGAEEAGRSRGVGAGGAAPATACRLSQGAHSATCHQIGRTPPLAPPSRSLHLLLLTPYQAPPRRLPPPVRGSPGGRPNSSQLQQVTGAAWHGTAWHRITRRRWSLRPSHCPSVCTRNVTRAGREGRQGGQAGRAGQAGMEGREGREGRQGRQGGQGGREGREGGQGGRGAWVGQAQTPPHLLLGLLLLAAE